VGWIVKLVIRPTIGTDLSLILVEGSSAVGISMTRKTFIRAQGICTAMCKVSRDVLLQ